MQKLFFIFFNHIFILAFVQILILRSLSKTIIPYKIKKYTSNFKMAQNKRVTSIEILVDDCLLAVFRHLSIVEKIRIERVNKRWNELSKLSWDTIKELDSNPHSWGFRSSKFLTVGPREIKSSEFTAVLKRCGKYLEVIHQTKVSDSQLAIASYCPNIKTLVTSGDAVGMTALTKNCKNIVELKLKDYTGSDKELSGLFKENKKLRVLKLVDIPKIIGSSLLNLQLLETFKLNNSRGLNSLHLVNAIKKMINLKVLKIRVESVMVNQVMLALQNHSNLEELVFDFFYEVGDFPDEENKLGKLLNNNKKLKVLSMDAFRFTVGDFLKNLNDDNLKVLNLVCCSYITFSYFNKYLHKFKQLSKFQFVDHNEINYNNYNQLIKFITSLTNLKFLKIQLDDPLKDKNNFIPLSTIVSLEELHLENPAISDECLKIFRKNLINLKTLNLTCGLGDCTVTDAGLYAITSLPNLENLEIEYIRRATIKGFNKMSNLKKFKCCHCQNIGDDGFKKVLKESEKLEYFSIFMCCITIDLLLFANEITKKRTNNITLYIEKNTFGNFDSKKFKKKVKKSPLLEFIKTEE